MASTSDIRDSRTEERRGKAVKAAGATGSVLALGATLIVATPGTAGAATFTVDSATDDGSGGTTLREAIEAANAAPGDDVITFAPALSGSTITLSGSEIAVTDGIDIQGPGAANLTISGDDSSRVFYVSMGSDAFTVSGLTLTDGDTDDDGGAIKVSDAGSVTITSVTFTDNYAEDNGGAVAIYGIDGSVTITGSTFTDNSADSDGGGLHTYDVAGAITVTDTTFTDNYASSDGGAATFYQGGGDIALTRVTVTGNAAPGDQAGGLFFYNLDAGADVTIADSTISDNVGEDGGGVLFYDSSNATLTISNTTISGNVSDEGGGGLRIYESGDVTIERSTISGNETGESGGGVYHYGSGTLTITNSTISGNGAAYGGGIFSGGSDGLALEHVTVTDNTASDGADGIYLLGDAVIDHSIIAANGSTDIDGEATAEVSNSLIGVADTGAVTVNDGGNNDIGVVDAGLLPLGDNGGDTETHALADTSPAREAGDPAFSPPPATDQRGLPRVQDVIDKGAWEFQPEPDSSPTTDTTPTSPTTEGDVDPDDVTQAPAATPTQANPTFTG